jgi:hypothetical protein
MWAWHSISGLFYDAERIYYDYDMPADESVPAVLVATSEAFHVPAAMLALSAGKHVPCEKAIGVAVEEVETLARTVEQSSLVRQVGPVSRSRPASPAVWPSGSSSGRDPVFSGDGEANRPSDERTGGGRRSWRSSTRRLHVKMRSGSRTR